MSEVDKEKAETLEDEAKVKELQDKIKAMEDHAKKREETIGRQGKELGDLKKTVDELDESSELDKREKEIKDLKDKLESKKKSDHVTEDTTDEPKEYDGPTAEELMEDLDEATIATLNETYKNASEEDKAGIDENEETRAQFVKQAAEIVSVKPVDGGSFFRTKTKKQKELSAEEKIRRMLRTEGTKPNTLIEPAVVTGVPGAPVVMEEHSRYSQEEAAHLTKLEQNDKIRQGGTLAELTAK